ncbi:cation:proton antiporter domain-containing protein [Kineococcus sp. SYSU DK004]|uniref:cation:proton antiporter domain-containing protein n=1 Tax=Kineococcus sp. SYSU DK004 TaxID=3383125 RepID=UPI003D7DA062
MTTDDLATGVLVLAGTLLCLVLVSRVTRRVSLSPVLLALVVGAVLGPQVTGVVDLTAGVPRHALLELVTLVALGLLTSSIGLRARPEDLRGSARRLVVLLLVVMPAMWLVTALGAGLLLGVPVAVALLLGAVLTPTDPGVASTVTSGVLARTSLPRRLRMSLQLESGANDGLAVPFVVLSGLLLAHPVGESVHRWAVEAGREVGVALVVGPALGLLAAQLLRFAERESAVAETYLPLTGPATALTALAAAHLLGGSGVLAAFLAGLALSLALPQEDLREPVTSFHESLSRVALVAVFLVLGSVLPLGAWAALGPGAFAFAAWVVLLRRLPATLPALRLAGTGTSQALFLGWFGPLGVAGVYYLAHVQRWSPPDGEHLFAVGSLAIVASVAAAGLTSAPGVALYRRREGSPADA